MTMSTVKSPITYTRNQTRNRRKFERIPAGKGIRFCYDDIMFTGTIKNISLNGMYIETDMRLYYYKLNFKIYIPLGSGTLEVPVKMVRLVQQDGFYEGMGVEVLYLSDQYRDFIESLRSLDTTSITELQSQ